MATKKKLLQAAAGAAGGAGLNVEEVFSTDLWAGNSSTQQITNGLDISTEGGLVWIKSRNASDANYLVDTERGRTKRIFSNGTTAEATENNIINSFNTDGYTLGGNTGTNRLRSPLRNYVGWTFRKAPKFFDVVTYTGDAVSGREIAHNLGTTPGCIIIKRTNDTGYWTIYHKDVGNTAALRLPLTNAANTYAQYWNNTSPTSTHFTLGSWVDVNGSGDSFVAYLFAHNDGDGEFGPDGDADIIKCGSFTTNSGGDASVDLGFEPQWIIYKRSDGTSNWGMNDNMRGWAHTYWNPLYADASNAESGFAATRGWPTATGFEFDGQLSASADYIYIAIRRGPMAVPEDATDVFAIDTYNATPLPTFESSFVTDMALYKHSTLSQDWKAVTRLLGATRLVPNSTTAETGESDVTWDFMNGWYSNSGTASTVYSWMWKRAPNYFDVVAYTGTGSTRTVSHNLGVAPEMMWVKRRNSTGGDWAVYHKDTGNTDYMYLNSTAASVNSDNYWNYTSPTDTEFTVKNTYRTNASGDNYIAYLFASLDGVSKVGSYTGNGTTSNTIDCGFSTGARFIIVKRTDSIGDWWVFDTERGITSSGNDPYLELNTTNAEASYNILNANSSGFEIIQPWNDINASGGSYIFYAIA